MVTASVDVVRLPRRQANDAALVAEIADLVNSVYAVAENGLWVEHATRTTRKEVAGYVDAQEITVARIGTRIVGCVRVQRLDLHTGEFGMLAAAPEERGRGVGRRLVRSAERECFHSGCSTMQLELLVPRTWSHPRRSFSRRGMTVLATPSLAGARSTSPTRTWHHCWPQSAISSSITKIWGQRAISRLRLHRRG